MLVERCVTAVATWIENALCGVMDLVDQARVLALQTSSIFNKLLASFHGVTSVVAKIQGDDRLSSSYPCLHALPNFLEASGALEFTPPKASA